MTDVVIIVNSGSSHPKFALFSADKKMNDTLLRGSVTGIGRKLALAVSMEGTPFSPNNPLKTIPSDAAHEWLTMNLLEMLRGSDSSFTPSVAGHPVDDHWPHKFTAAKICSGTSPVAVHVIPANEEAVILKDVQSCRHDGRLSLKRVGAVKLQI